MKKHTDKYYLNRIARAEAALRRWESMERRLTVITDRHLADATPSFAAKLGKAWDRCQKGIWKAWDRVEACRLDYVRRNRDIQDHYFARLVSDNID